MRHCQCSRSLQIGVAVSLGVLALAFMGLVWAVYTWVRRAG